MSAEVAALDRLLRPRSVAVIGGREAARVAEQLERIGYPGEVWPVHPHNARVAGRPCFASIADLPGAPDASFVGVNRALTVEVVAALARRGAGGAVCYASGFKESEAHREGGAELQRALLEAAGTMPIIGPNCYGLINYLDRALLWPDQHGGAPLAADARGVALITQSSNIAINLTMQQRGLPLAYLLTAGNQAQLGISRLALELLADPRVSVLALHLEGVDDAGAFHAMALAARERGVPVVVLRAGLSEQGRRSALTHTASLAGDAEAARAFFRRCAVAEVTDLETLIEASKLLHHGGPLTGRELLSMSCSGGEAALMADAAEGHGLRFAPLTQRQRTGLSASLGTRVHLDNPLDYHTYIWSDAGAMGATFEAAVDGPADLALLVLDYPRLDRCDDDDWDLPEATFAGALESTGRRGAILATLPENLPEARSARLATRGIPTLCGLRAGLAAVRAAAEVGQAWAAPPPATPWPAPPSGPTRVVLESEAKARLAAAGLPVPAGDTAGDVAVATALARRLGYPVAVKACGLAHKSDRDGVRLGLRDDAAVDAAVRHLLEIAPEVRVERMLPGAVAEVLVGIAPAPPFGHLLTLASGGVLTELLGDAVHLLLPTGRAEIRAALARLRVARLIEGYRGQAAGDGAALETAILDLIIFVARRRDSLLELEVNPMMVARQGEGAWIADALMRERDVEESPS